MSTGAQNVTQRGGSTGATSTGGGPAGATSPTATLKVIKPTMGEILQVDKDAFVAVVGGKPNSVWTALESPMDADVAPVEPPPRED